MGAGCSHPAPCCHRSTFTTPHPAPQHRRAEQKAAQELKVLRKAGLSSSLAEDEDESIRQSYRWGQPCAASDEHTRPI